MENGTFLNEDYFEHLLAEIREIRLSERRFYQKITDIYATSLDDVCVAKNYLKENELEDMGRIVNAFLDLAESRAKRHIPMTMEDWAKRLDVFLTSDERPLLDDKGRVTAEEEIIP